MSQSTCIADLGGSVRVGTYLERLRISGGEEHFTAPGVARQGSVALQRWSGVKCQECIQPLRYPQTNGCNTACGIELRSIQ